MSTNMSVRSKQQSTAKPKVSGLPKGEDAAQPSLLERVQAFANLRFPAVIMANNSESDPREKQAMQVE